MRPIICYLLILCLAYFPAAQAEKLSAQERYDLVLDLLVNDSLIEEGIGLERVKIGESMRLVAERLGTPSKTASLVDGLQTWIYELDSGTQLAISGTDIVKLLSFKGGPNSLYVTRRGASFGMPYSQIISLYGQPDNTDTSTRLNYSSTGVSFVQERGATRVIEIYAPQ